MSALIEYLDRDKTTIAILRDYHDQHWKIENDPKRIKELSASMTAPKAMSATPVHGGGSRSEEILCEMIDKKAVIEKGYRRAVEYRSEFTPCWERLSDEERELLTLRFVDHIEGGGIKAITLKYNISRTEAYRRCENALKRLSKLVFW